MPKLAPEDSFRVLRKETKEAYEKLLDPDTVRRVVMGLIPDRLSVNFHNKDGFTFYCTKDAIYLPKIWDNMTEGEYCRYIMGMLHEIMHNTPPHNDIFNDEYTKLSPLLGLVHNVLADINIDYRGYQSAAGEKMQGIEDIYDSGTYNFYSSLPEVPAPQSKEDWILYTLCQAKVESLQSFLPTMRLYDSEYLDSEGYLKKWHDQGWQDLFQSMDYTSDRFPAMCKMMKEVFDYEVKEEELQQEQKGNSKSEQSEMGDREEEGASSSSKRGDTDGEQVDEGASSVVKYKDILEMDDHAPEPRITGTGVRILYDENDLWYRDRYVGYPVCVVPPERAFDNSIRSFYERSGISHGTAKRVAKYWQAQTRKNWETNLKRGRLHDSRLANIYTRTGDERFKVFKKKSARKELDTVVTLLVDASGSMYGEKTALSAIGAAMLAECTKKLHIPTRLYTFSTSYQKNTLTKVKGKYDNYSWDVLMERLEGSYPHGCNSDGMFVKYCYHELMKDRETKKILIVLSDGQPAGYSISGDEASFLPQVTRMIEHTPDVDLYGIGICDNSVEMFYRNYQVIRDPEDLPDAILALAKDGVFL